MPSDQVFYLIMIINGVGIFGRIVPAWLVTRSGEMLHVLTPVTFMAGFMLYLWISVKNELRLYAWTVFYGFFANAVQALFVGGVGSLTQNKQKMGVRIGMVFSIISLACLTGPPIAGELIDARGGDFLYAQLFGGTSMVLGSIGLVGAYWAKKVLLQKGGTEISSV